MKVTFERLDEWIRRRLRCIQWRQWKKPRTQGHMNVALPRRFFDERGLVCLVSRYSALRVAMRTAGYGTVRPVVWEDGGGDPASYPMCGLQRNADGEAGSARWRGVDADAPPVGSDDGTGYREAQPGALFPAGVSPAKEGVKHPRQILCANPRACVGDGDLRHRPSSAQAANVMVSSGPV